MRCWLVLAMALTGCAAHSVRIGGKSVPRLDLGYTDGNRYFSFTHRDAYPEPIGPSDGKWTYGGHLAGVVCGVNASLDAEYYGRYLAVDGFFDERPVRYFVRERADGRHIDGSFDGASGITLKLTRSTLDGDIALPFYDEKLHLRAAPNDSDALVGSIDIYGFPMPYIIRGAHVLREMTPEDQALVLPLMVTCPTTVASADGRYVFGFDITGKSYGRESSVVKR
ncbi:MAG TPA: hypothetical protein VHB97_07090 [Polyangia bacterium]|nr:hypothetical protein [Polyangia bacterium]